MSRESRRYSVFAAAGLAVAFGAPHLFSWLGISRHQIADPHDDLMTLLAEWGIVAILGGIAFAAQREPASHFGLCGFGWRDLAAMMGVWAGIFLAGGIVRRFIPMPPQLADFRAIAAVPLALRSGLALTAGACEEFMFRGFGIEELAHLTRNRWAAGFISLVFFALAHAGRYGAGVVLILPAIPGAGLTVLYLWRRNLPVCMVLHALIDGVYLVLGPLSTNRA